ncbi:MAG: hypothetical protein AB1457_17160 [Chloroflexota bacterium]
MSAITVKKACKAKPGIPTWRQRPNSSPVWLRQLCIQFYSVVSSLDGKPRSAGQTNQRLDIAFPLDPFIQFA